MKRIFYFADQRFMISETNITSAAGTFKLGVLSDSPQREETLLMAMGTSHCALEDTASVQPHDASPTQMRSLETAFQIAPRLNSAVRPHLGKTVSGRELSV